MSDEVLTPEIEEEEDKGPNILKPEHLTFARAVAEGKGVSEAYKLAYPKNAENKYVRQYAHKLIKNPKVRQEIELLQQAARMRFILDAPRAAEKLIELSKDAKSDKVQLEATKDILNRAGLQPPQRVETVHVGIFGSASQDDIRNILRQQLENKQESEVNE